MNAYEEQEVVEVDEILEFATQADEYFMTYEQEQAYIKECTEKVNVIYTHKIAAQLNKGRQRT